MDKSRIPFDVIPYWQNLGATHGRLENGQEGPLFTQTVESLSPPRYRAVLTAYRVNYRQVMTSIEQSVTEREQIARRHRGPS